MADNEAHDGLAENSNYNYGTDALPLNQSVLTAPLGLLRQMLSTTSFSVFCSLITI